MKIRKERKCKMHFNIKLHACERAKNKQNFYAIFEKYKVTVLQILLTAKQFIKNINLFWFRKNIT